MTSPSLLAGRTVEQFLFDNVELIIVFRSFLNISIFKESLMHILIFPTVQKLMNNRQMVDSYIYN